MSKKEPAWHAYREAVTTFIPRCHGEELEHRAKLLHARDWANEKRRVVDWQADQMLTSITSLVSAYGLSSKLHPGQVKTVCEVVLTLAQLSATLQGSDLP